MIQGLLGSPGHRLMQWACPFADFAQLERPVVKPLAAVCPHDQRLDRYLHAALM